MKTILKICNKCKVAKPRSEFYCSRASLDGLQYGCKACDKIRRKARRCTPALDRKYQLKALYGLQVADYQALVDRTGGKCPLCNKPHCPEQKRGCLYVDHDHATGKIRGVLCLSCNGNLGWLERVTIERVQDYLGGLLNGPKYRVQNPSRSRPGPRDRPLWH